MLDPMLAAFLASAVLCALVGFVGGRISTAPKEPRRAPAVPLLVIARIVHEANRAYAASLGEFKKGWVNIEPEVKQSLIEGIKFRLANPDATPEQMHRSWCKSKVAQGYTYGPTVCHRSRTHPCLVPYGKLPESQRFKDYLFSAIVDLAR